MLPMKLSAPIRLRPQTSHHTRSYHTWPVSGNALHVEPFSSFKEPPLGLGTDFDETFAVMESFLDERG